MSEPATYSLLFVLGSAVIGALFALYLQRSHADDQARLNKMFPPRKEQTDDNNSWGSE